MIRFITKIHVYIRQRSVRNRQQETSTSFNLKWHQNCGFAEFLTRKVYTVIANAVCSNNGVLTWQGGGRADSRWNDGAAGGCSCVVCDRNMVSLHGERLFGHCSNKFDDNVLATDYRSGKYRSVGIISPCCNIYLTWWTETSTAYISFWWNFFTLKYYFVSGWHFLAYNIVASTPTVFL